VGSFVETQDARDVHDTWEPRGSADVVAVDVVEEEEEEDEDEDEELEEDDEELEDVSES
jgi:hypothetical protein